MNILDNMLLTKLVYDYFNSRKDPYLQVMDNTYHAYIDPDTNEVIHSSSHKENSVFNHTLMVLDEVRNNYMKSEDLKTYTILLLSGLTHDIGKYKARLQEPKHKKTYFNNHEHIGVYYTMSTLYNFLEYLSKHNYDISYIKYSDIIQTIIYVVAHHDIYKDNVEDIMSKHGKYAPLLAKFIRCDCNGRISDNKRSMSEEDYQTLINYHHIEEDIDGSKPELVLVCGLPAIGKSTYIKNNFSNYSILCRDDIINNYAKEHDMTFKEAWKDLTDKNKHKDIDLLFNQKFLNSISNRQSIVIDKVNLSKKTRRTFLEGSMNYLEKYHKDAIQNQYIKKIIVLLDSFDNILSRRSIQDNKEITEDALDSFIVRSNFPCMNEADIVEYVIIK